MSKHTSAIAYRELTKTHFFSDTQEQILSAIKSDGPMTRKELAASLSRPINSICDATLRLVEMKALYETEGFNKDSGKKAMILSLPGNPKPTNQSKKVPKTSKDTPKLQAVGVDKAPTAKELLCAQILQTTFTRVQNQFVSQVLVEGVVFAITIEPISKV